LSILHITDSFHPETGGVERVVENLGAIQVTKGHRVFVISKSIPGESQKDHHRGMNIFRYPHTARPTILNYLTSVSGSKSVFRKLLEKEKINLVHCHLTLSSIGPIQIAKNKGIPIVVSFYGPWDLEFLAESLGLMEKTNGLYRSYLSLQMALQRKMQSRLLKAADKIILLSDHSRKQAARLCTNASRNAIKIPGGIQSERFLSKGKSNYLRDKLGISQDRILIFTLRRLVKRMGVDMLIEAFQACIQKGLDAELVIGGKGPLMDELKDMADKTGVGNRIHFAGFIPDDHLADAYHDADLLVLPTRAEENFGLPILEAAACGTPVIGTPIGSIPEVLGEIDREMIASDATPESIADKIMWAASRLADLKERFSGFAPKVRNDHSWEKIASMTQEVYSKVVG
jgi:glycosyltransferase involved in cell wall biosynthesis